MSAGGSGSMAMVGVLAAICSSISAGAGAYFYMGKEGELDTSKEDETEFRSKYQDAVRDLEYEKQSSSQVEVAKTDLQLAQERLEIARLEFEKGEYANEADKSAAQARLFSAEKDVETANNRLDEAETLSEKAAIDRERAEKAADTALRLAISEATRLETVAVGEAKALVAAAQGRLNAAIIENQRILADAEGYAKALGITSKAERDALVNAKKAQLEAAQLEAQIAKENMEKAELELKEKEAKEAARLLKEAEEKAKRDEAARQAAAAAAAAAAKAKEDRDAAAAKAREDRAYARRVTDAENGGLDDAFAQCYLDNNPDLQNAFGATNIGAAKDHWYHHGIHEYRGGSRQNNYVCDGSGAKTASSLQVGQAAICGANAIGPAGAVFRYDGNNTLRWYPNPDIADSWDSGWQNTKTIDCKGARLGANMAYKESGAGASSAEGWIDCESYDSDSCNKYGCERDYEGDCLGTFSGRCADYGLRGPNLSGDCY